MTGSLVVGTLAIAPEQWNDVEGDGSRLVAIVVINGVSLHLEALEVQAGADGVQRVVSPILEDGFLAFTQTATDGPFETATINGRAYVLIAFPFQ
jgi:hypothetical protein